MTVPDGLPVHYQREWQRFDLWCDGADRTPLPADPLTVLDYLHESGGTPATARRRVSVINTAHRLHGHTPPGGAEPIRRAVNHRRAQRLARRAAAIERLLPAIPIWGWPHGLVGRRDRALLVLAAAGLPAPRISALTRTDVTIVGDGTVLIGDPALTVVAGPDPYRCPAGVLRDWLDVHTLVPHPAGHALLEHHLEQRTLPTPTGPVPAGDTPLFTSFDRRGWTPLPDIDPETLRRPALLALTGESVTAIVRAHLSGRASTHRRRRRPTRPATTQPQPPPIEEIYLDPDYHDAGIAARHHGTAELNTEIDDLLADFDTDADQLNARILELLDIATESA
ncbi:hypothetical protein OG225_40900 (plasmid) [Nocardia sp. NBC_01377]|uniref:hypothetical protein n=1 Tax=Nocardia sp. NBC_01377 TaxID=2903595 RepID=UPI002F91269B